jgi:hypothetical protein
MNKVPYSRHLKVLAFDPSLTTRLETANVNELTLSLPWEELEPGPIGEYVEVVDIDPASKVFYPPVDLNDRYLLAQNGHEPSESNPQFHQQMAYAVSMTTIRQFERALGRVAFWADRSEWVEGVGYIDQFVPRLRIYPHALREQNAYYSPAKKALLFGYFPTTIKDKHNTPGTLVFTCLSHDIIAHETTHALLDGVHPRLRESTNPDVLAFHEAFADIVALFQHFSYPAVLENEIKRTCGNLETENLLGELAQQFGHATGRGGALRRYLGEKDEITGEWKPLGPDPHALSKTKKPHDRGAILVAAVFRAFLLIYRASSADLFRIATSGTGVLPEGDIHPDLTRRLAREAAKYADRILQMCIRAIDYCPPVDITFGDFLRGVITADLDYAPNDTAGYRTVFIQSFREWGIYPRGVTSMGKDTLVWPTGDEIYDDLLAEEKNIQKEDAKTGFKSGFLKFEKGETDWSLESDRYEVWKIQDQLGRKLWNWLIEEGDSYGSYYSKIFGLIIEDRDAPRTVYRNGRGDHKGHPTVEVHSVRPAQRKTINGEIRTDLVVEITQRRRGYYDPAQQAKMDDKEGGNREQMAGNEHGDFIFRAGATILIDLATQEIRRVIRTPGTIASDEELDRVRRFRLGEPEPADNAFDAGIPDSFGITGGVEPFALLHQQQED